MAPRCTLCGTDVPRPWFTRRRATWWRCPACGLLLVHPQPEREALAELYEAAYYTKPKDHSPKNLRKWGDRVRTIETVCPPCRVLDVGCGGGEFLTNALKRGWEAWGLELAAGAVKAMPEPVQRRVTVGTLEEAPFPEESFDALTYFDVIEHVRDPLHFLRSGRRYLRRDGMLVITTPDAGSLKARLKGRFWKYLDFNRYLHLYHFSAETLERALTATGFEVARWFRRTGTPLFLAARKL
jgi:2-polyprenyl-3-methyl-5-hydroxy-6-metoxy-1,4-benzoquinol methylase/predicted RNA-binding Zn-ribbon protein involved in translation (DUF1610 family)